MKFPFHSRSGACAPLLAACALVGSASAATLSWNHPGSGNWSDPGNWSPPFVPGAFDTARISGTGSLTVVVDRNLSVNQLLLENPKATLRIEGSAAEGDGVLQVANGFENRGTIELGSPHAAGGGAALVVTLGTLTNAVGAVLRVVGGEGRPRALHAQIDNRGTLEVGADLALRGQVANSGTVNLREGMTLTIQSATTWTHRGGLITGTGTLTLAAGSTLTLESDLRPGSYRLNAPSLTVNGPGKRLGSATGEVLLGAPRGLSRAL